MRQAAKSTTFGILYQAGAPTVADQINKEARANNMDYRFSLEEAQDVIDQYFKTFKGLKKWIDVNKDFITKNGYIYSHFGRKRRLPNVLSTDGGIKSHAVRSGLNFLVQSPSSDINLLGAIDMNNFIKENGLKTRIFALVHDSILAEVPEYEIEVYTENLKKFIQKDRGLSIPGCPIGCDFDIGDDYSMGKFEEKYGLL
jgi:DNA polymerase I-like protein with 3'-5' exonuclease and polymerase domains